MSGEAQGPPDLSGYWWAYMAGEVEQARYGRAEDGQLYCQRFSWDNTASEGEGMWRHIKPIRPVIGQHPGASLAVLAFLEGVGVRKEIVPAAVARFVSTRSEEPVRWWLVGQPGPPDLETWAALM